jgi:hypothetical protein
MDGFKQKKDGKIRVDGDLLLKWLARRDGSSEGKKCSDFVVDACCFAFQHPESSSRRQLAMSHDMLMTKAT